MLVGKEDASYDIALDFTSQLPQIAPVLYATGNHEQRMRENPEIYQASYADYRQQLKDRGVLFLENGSCRIEAGTVLLEISGVELPSASYKKLKKLPDPGLLILQNISIKIVFRLLKIQFTAFYLPIIQLI